MKNNWVKVSIIIFLSCFLYACFEGDEEVNLAQDLVVGTSPDFPPFEFMKSQKVVGFDIDFVNAIGNVLGKKVIVKEYEFPAIMPALKANKINMAISGFTRTPARAENFSFSEIYYHNMFAVLQLLDTESITIDNIRGKTIGAQLGSTMHTTLTELNANHYKDQNIDILALNQNNQLVEQLKLKRVDGVLLEKATAEAYVKNNPNMRFTLLNEIEMGYAIVLQKDSALLAEVNQAIDTLKANGTLSKIQKKWLDAND